MVPSCVLIEITVRILCSHRAKINVDCRALQQIPRIYRAAGIKHVLKGRRQRPVTTNEGHRNVTGPSLGHLFEHIREDKQRLHAFIAGTGSAGTIAAGDHLKAIYGANIVATEPLECPTMINNGYGEHNIQGIGDKHIPLIHNVMNMDYLIFKVFSI